MKKVCPYLILVFIGLLSLAMHYKHLSTDLTSIHVWRQAQTHSTSINFYEEDMNILNPRKNNRGNGDGIFRMEFPLMQWIAASLFHIFDNQIVVSRTFMLFTGFLTILGIYSLLFTLFNNQIISIIGAWTLNFSPSFYYYTINPLPDNLALCLSVWGLYFFFRYTREPQLKFLLFSGLMLSLGALCKLPFILYFIVPLQYFLRMLFNGTLKRQDLVHSLIIHSMLSLPFAWYLLTIRQWSGGNMVVKGILAFNGSLSELLNYIQHNLFSTLPELLLNYAAVPLFIAAFYYLIVNKAYKDSRFTLLASYGIIVTVYFFYELNAIAKIHDYYLFPFYPSLIILISYGAGNLLKNQNALRWITFTLIILIPITCYLRIEGRWDPAVPGFNKYLLEYKNELRNAVPKDALVVAGNDESKAIFFYYIDKKGWGFNDDNISAEELRIMIDQGAQYLYSDSRKIENDKNINQLLGKIILEAGTIRVYELNKVLP